MDVAQGPYTGLAVFTDPYLTDHEANPTAFLGLCSLICSMSVLGNRNEAPTPTCTPCLIWLLVHKSIRVNIQENKGLVVVCEASRLQMQR